MSKAISVTAFVGIHNVRVCSRKYDESRGIELVKETLKRGINYLETGPWYGQGSSERTIGKVCIIH